jgi:uncharacterized protein YukE
MAGVLARNGHPAEPSPPPALPAFALPQPAASPDADLLEIRPEELRAAVGRMEQALREAEAALAGLQEALSLLETWEGYARLGFRDGVEAGRRALVDFLSEASRIITLEGALEGVWTGAQGRAAAKEIPDIRFRAGYEINNLADNFQIITREIRQAFEDYIAFLYRVLTINSDPIPPMPGKLSEEMEPGMAYAETGGAPIPV